jgi:DinB superfamily
MTIDHFNHTIDIWISALDNYSFSELIAKPDNASWSLGQVYGHLVEETDFYITQMKACIELPDNSSGQMTADAMHLFSNNTYPDIKIKGDPISAAHVQQPAGKEELLANLIQLRRHMNQVWTQMNNSSKDGKTLHPGHGYLSALEWFQHADMHMRHHLRQKSRLDLFLNRV